MAPKDLSSYSDERKTSEARCPDPVVALQGKKRGRESLRRIGNRGIKLGSILSQENYGNRTTPLAQISLHWSC
jgi:hypothetical protein